FDCAFSKTPNSNCFIVAPKLMLKNNGKSNDDHLGDIQ
ncbi:MAG: hypothetical protein ACI901_001753, partial [Octadecabacter sp.]